MDNLNKNLINRVEFVVGKSISQVQFASGDLLVYPANYGLHSLFTEGVSINVLEMACIGIPSLISKNGNTTWAELSKLNIVHNLHQSFEVSSRFRH